MRTLLIAHRGDTIHFPENTMDAFESAFEHGADGIECDIQLIQDKLIIVHNYLFDKNGGYPTLENVLDKFGKMGRIEIEIKSFSYDIITKLTIVLAHYPKFDYEITTSELFLIPEIRNQLPQASIGAIFLPKLFEDWMTKEFIQRKIVETTKTLQANVAHVPAGLITQTLVKALHSERLKIHSHNYRADSDISKEVDEYKRFCDLGIDQCTFDNIHLLSKLK